MTAKEPRAKFSLQAELARLAPEERPAVEERLTALRDQLRRIPEYGDEIHDGSRMAWAYATDAEGILDLEDIAHEMASVHYLHRYTDYPEWIQERLRAAANVLHEAYPDLYWDKLWRLVVRHGVPIVKYAAALQLMEKGASGPPTAEACCGTEEDDNVVAMEEEEVV